MPNTITTPYFKSFHLNDFFCEAFLFDKNDKRLGDIPISKFLYHDKYQANYFKRVRNINELLHDFWKIVDIEYNLINDKKIPEDHSYYKNLIQRIEQMPTVLADQFYSLLAVIYLEKPFIHSHWDIPLSLKKEKTQTNTILHIEFISNEAYAIDFIFDKFSTSELENLEIFGGNDYVGKLKKLTPYNIDIKTASIRDLISCHKKDLYNNIYKFKKINDNLNLAYNPPLIVKDLDLKTLFPESLEIIQEESLNKFETEHNINNNKIIVSLENIAKFNFMNKSFSNLIKNQASYGLDGKNYSDFTSLKEHFLYDPFLKLHMEDYINLKIKSSRTNNPKWQYFTLEDKIEHKDISTMKRNKL